jgi:hypothetical protein
MYGASDVGFDPRTAKDANCIVVWGANPFASAPHQHKHWLKEARRRRSSSTRCATRRRRRRPALQLFPGSDAALAFRHAACAERERMIDRAFLAAHTVGWDELEPTSIDCSPEWAAPITGLKAAQIEEAARIYGQGPSLLWLGQGLQRQPTGGNVSARRAAAGGNRQFRQAGRRFLYLNGGTARHRQRLSGGLASAPGRQAQGQSHGSGGNAERSQEGAGARHLEHQHRRLQP